MLEHAAEGPCARNMNLGELGRHRLAFGREDEPKTAAALERGLGPRKKPIYRSLGGSSASDRYCSLMG